MSLCKYIYTHTVCEQHAITIYFSLIKITSGRKIKGIRMGDIIVNDRRFSVTITIHLERLYVKFPTILGKG